ncbi:uncharacterized protein LOC129568563 [Sitodiplosis mosellana]|uniref:uncharacterized protein LOC129568563 n=1 Tax=Sitodiplosis mosellana TaxID=263140 RepID=UPI0024449BFB|nr:uncharacterized protein LOC129568563 [Sitodiplosis mosellana]
MEVMLANIWRQLLGIDRVSRHDNFFALGGHSLLIVRMLAHLRQIGLDTTVREVFGAPTLATLALNIDRYQIVPVPPNLITTNSTGITPEMLPLINLSQADIDAIIAQVPGGIANIQDIYGLAPLQHGILFHHLMAKEGDPYLTVSRLSFIDRTTLERYTHALQQVIKRHDILRTAFFWEGLNEPVQVVQRQVPSILTEITLDNKFEVVFEQLNNQYNPRHYRLDFTQAPLLRLLAAQTSKDNWVAVQLIHHIIVDFTTMERLQAEIRTIFDQQSENLRVPTPFRQVVAQARIEVIQTDYTRFFSEMLTDVDDLALPFGLNHTGWNRMDMIEAQLQLSHELIDLLRGHARHLRVSLSSLCHLAWAQVLSRASGREAVVFGTVLLGRLQAGEGNNNIMGPMINTLPLRLDIDDKSVETAVCHTHARLSALLAHEYAPLALVQRCSGVPAGLPLFSALMNYRHKAKTEHVNASLPGVRFLGSEGRTNYPLTLSLDDNDDTLCLSVQVVSQVSAARVGAYMQQALVSLSDALVNKSKQTVRTFTVVPPEEWNLLLNTWNNTSETYPLARCLHQLFEAQVERDGQSIAVEYEGETLSYTELNSQANRLAHFLIAQGIKPDDRIALCVQRSTKLLVAMLGILKAGGAYVPLDPKYPSQRLTNILQNSNPRCLLADAVGQEVLGNHQIPLIDLKETLSEKLSTHNPDLIKLGLTPVHLAYIIYTSGSTGTPKGVMVEHRNVTNCLYFIKDAFTSEDFKHTSFSTSVNFDMSLYECFAPLSMGTTLHIMTDALALSTSSDISMLSTIPSVVTTILDTDCLPTALKALHLIGEPLKASLIKRIFTHTQVNELCNLYGLTETSFFSTLHRFKRGDDVVETIGRPIANTRVYLLDAYGEPVPLGAEGELYISGDSVARGYLNRPELTAERFLPDPFSETPAARMYRTGDRARYLPYGDLVFLGRMDQQLKIRGFRIEPGEIEARLVEYPQVHDAIVQSYGNGSDARVVAYIVTDPHTSIVQNMRTYLSKLLPDYMIPTAYICLPSLPLTPNGKLDRRALPAPDDVAFALQHYEAPLGEMEVMLANIWRQLLGIEQVSRHDNFFALGGHSLLVVRMLVKLRQIGLDTAVREVFDAPTLAALASNIDRYQAVTIPPNLIATDSTEITPEMLPLINLSQAEIDAIIAQVPGGVANIQDSYGLTPLQSGMLYHHMMTKESDPYLMIIRLEFSDQKTLEHYTDALQQVITRHDILRTAFFWEGLSEPVQVVLRQVPSVLTAFTIDDTGETVLDMLSQSFESVHYRVDLAQAPLMRLMASPTLDGSWIALQMMHHIIIDHSTLERLQAEVHNIMGGKIDKLTMSTSFRNLVAQTRIGVSPVQYTRFFTEILGDIDEPTLPFGLRDVGQDGTNINEIELILPQMLNNQLRTLARKLQVNLASIFHLAFAQVLSKASGREAVVFGTVILGRLHFGEGINSNIMGPTINTLPLRLDIDETSVETAVRLTHARLSSLMEHEHAPLVLVQRCSGMPVGAPLFSSLINYRHKVKTEHVNASFPGVRFLGSEGRTNYPLTLSLDDSDDILHLSVQVVLQVSAARVGAYMQQALVSLSDALANKSKQPVRTITVLPPEECTLLLNTWNNTSETYPLARCLHQLFEAQVERDGQSIAVEYEGETLSYAELNSQANRLAHFLIAQGIKPDDRIALCVQRSTKLVVAMLGILKAGGAYVPLDPKYSSQRLTNILQNSNPRCLLADAVGQEVLGNHQIPLIDLKETLSEKLSTHNPDLIKLGLTPVHLAYIIYTSGSTGTPKGVMVEHRNVTNCLYFIKDAFTSEDFEHTSFSTSVNFDMSLYECFAPLSMGTTLHIMTDALALSTSSDISMLSTIPSVVTTILDTDCLPTALKALHLIGEPLKASLIKRIFTHTQVNELCNLYGLTETSFFSTLRRFKRGDDVVETIGRPIANTRVYLLDAYGEPVPLRAEGELYISGDSVARGYLNRPELTAERFLPDPFSETPAARMYRTGDRARYLLNGDLVFLGRMDQQLKIRGFRIEPGEIEARLVEHPQVHDAIVQSYGNGSDARVVAYIVADRDTSLFQDLHTYLSTLLPHYMIPAAYVCLPSLPLTPNGKLDRRALPPPDDETFARQKYEAPQNEMEEHLVVIWSELLNIERISRHDNFFELGGHSLLVMHLSNKARFYNIHIDTRDIYSFPILKDLAERITNHFKRLYSDVAIPARQFGNETPLFLLPDGDGGISYAFELAHDIDKNIPIYVLPWSSPENIQPSSIEEMADAMISLLKKIQPNGPYAMAGYSGGGILAYEIGKQLISNGCTVSFLGLIDTYPPIANVLTETEIFVTFLLLKYPVFKTINDSMWWARVMRLTLNEAIEEIKKMNIYSKSSDIEWEALLSKQRHNYQKICAAFKFDSLSINTCLFKAVDYNSFHVDNEHLDKYFKNYMDNSKKLYSCPKLGWENFDCSTDFHVIAVEGDHFTMVKDQKNRFLLGKHITKSHRQGQNPQHVL